MVYVPFVAALAFGSGIAEAAAAHLATSQCTKVLPGKQKLNTVQNFTITSGGLLRSYLLFIPPTYTPSTPLILSYHGGSRDSHEQLELDQMTSPQYNTDHVVAYPMGESPLNDPTWQGAPKQVDGVSDVIFTDDLITHLVSAYCIDPTRIYATGKSDGGGMVGILACDPVSSKRIAAFAPVSGAFYVDADGVCEPETVTIPCPTKRTNIPILEFHGGNDPTAPYDGKPHEGLCLPAIPHWAQSWATKENLGTTNVTTMLTSDTFVYTFGTGSKAGLVTQIFDVTIGHDWPSTKPNSDNSRSGHNVATFDATPIILDFFSKHVLS